MSINQPYARTKVMCVETGQVFENRAEVIKTYNVSKGALANHLNGRFKTLRGLHFAKI